MNKKEFTLIMAGCGVAVVVGIILIAMNATPYLNCSSWIRYGDARFMDYALANIGKHKLGYFGGIGLIVAGAVGGGLTALDQLLKKKNGKGLFL